MFYLFIIFCNRRFGGVIIIICSIDDGKFKNILYTPTNTERVGKKEECHNIPNILSLVSKFHFNSKITTIYRCLAFFFFLCKPRYTYFPLPVKFLRNINSQYVLSTPPSLFFTMLVSLNKYFHL